MSLGTLNFFCLFVVGMFVFGFDVRAASCCAGGASAFGVIHGDEALKLSIGHVLGRELGRSMDFGQEVKSQAPVLRNEQTVSAVYKFSYELQVGLQAGWAQMSDQSLGWAFKDTSVGGFMPLYVKSLYDPFMPDLYAGVVFKLPTGVSFYENRRRATDEDLYAYSFQVLAMWKLARQDVSFEMVFDQAQAKQFGDLELNRGALVSAQLSYGLSPLWAPAFRFGIWIRSVYQSSNIIKQEAQGFEQKSLARVSFPIGASVSYAFDDLYAVSANYQGSGWFQSQNTQIVDTYSLQMTRRFF